METKKNKSITQIISLIVGCMLFIIGVAGLLFPTFGGLHLSPFHSTVAIIAGGILFYNGYKDNERDSFLACFWFGLFFLFHSLAGFAFGNQESPGQDFQAPDPELLRMIPNFTELGLLDHMVNGIIGLVLLGGAFDWWRIQHERKRWNRHDRRRERHNQLAHR